MHVRVFNKISINHSKKLIIKSSNNVFKIKDEIQYYLNIPSNIYSFFPRLLDYETNYKSYTLEYIPCDTLSEVFLDASISLEEGKEILKKLSNILLSMQYYKPETRINAALFHNFLIKKTIQRFKELTYYPFFNQLTTLSTLIINDKPYKNFFELQKKFIKTMNCFLTKKPDISLIHGDFCLSNILYCPQTKTIKLIDPRGSYGVSGVYGHPYYDYAKLIQGFHGKYDNILNGKYVLKETTIGNYFFEIPETFLMKNLYHYCCDLFEENNIDIPFLYLIEASLFLSMVPLHYECLERQTALFLKGIMLLNDCLGETQ